MNALSLALLPLVLSAAAADPVSVVVDVAQPGAAPSRVAIFFEDMNYWADGGLYPERIRNRSFEFDEPLLGWKHNRPPASTTSLTVMSEGGLGPANNHFLRVRLGGGQAGLAPENEGFFGIGVEKGASYEFSA